MNLLGIERKKKIINVLTRRQKKLLDEKKLLNGNIFNADIIVNKKCPLISKVYRLK